MKKLIVLIIFSVLLSCMNEKKNIDLEKDFLKTNIENLSLAYENDSTVVFKVSDLDRYRLYGAKPKNIIVFKKDDDEVTKLVLEIRKEEYDNFINELYSFHSKPNVYVSYKDSEVVETGTMIWKKGNSEQNEFFRNKINQYDFLAWNIRGYDLLIKNNPLDDITKPISVEIIESRVSLKRIKG